MSFKQTVNLKDKMKQQRVVESAPVKSVEEDPKPKLKKKKAPLRQGFGGQVVRKVSKPSPVSSQGGPKKAVEDKHDIDELFAADQEEETAVPRANVKRNMQQIDRPVVRERQEGDDIYKKISIVLFVILLGVLGYFLFFANRNAPVAEVNMTPDWYAVKLTTGEIYYGEIIDTKADPVVVEKVYYDYDQLNNNSKGEDGEAGNLRLVKRGKETHGPEGTMNIVRSQVLFMEPLKDDSKVLKAILDYEK